MLNLTVNVFSCMIDGILKLREVKQLAQDHLNK